MKKLVLVSLKTFAFFVGWAICASILPIPDTKSAAVWRFWAEMCIRDSGNTVTVTETTNGDYYFQDKNGTGFTDNGDGTWSDENGNSYTEID